MATTKTAIALVAGKRLQSFIFGLVSAALLAGSSQVLAGPMFNGFDLANFDFDVTTYDYTGNGTNGTATASGTSNGIGWTISPTNLWSGRTTTDGTFAFDPLMPNLTDNLHVSIDFTVTFDSVISDLIVALDNDNTTDSLNIELVPVYTQGLNVDGTQISLQTGGAGGLAWFQNVTSLTITHVNINAADGFDFAFHAVPEPGMLFLLGLGLMGLALNGRRKEISYSYS